MLRAASNCLTKHGILHWRQNNGATYDPKRKIFRKPNGPGFEYGVPDILGCVNGVCVGFECKSATGTLSEHQKAFKSRLEAAGGRYFVIRSVDDVERALASMRQAPLG